MGTDLSRSCPAAPRRVWHQSFPSWVWDGNSQNSGLLIEAAPNHPLEVRRSMTRRNEGWAKGTLPMTPIGPGMEPGMVNPKVGCWVTDQSPPDLMSLDHAWLLLSVPDTRAGRAIRPSGGPFPSVNGALRSTGAHSSPT
jgi:hypothetical protein